MEGGFPKSVGQWVAHEFKPRKAISYMEPKEVLDNGVLPEFFNMICVCFMYVFGLDFL